MLPVLLPRVLSATSQSCPTRCFAKKIFDPSALYGKLGVVGVPFGKGQKIEGKHEIGLKITPDMLRSTGFIDDLIELGTDVEDHGNVTYEPECGLSLHNMHNLDHFAPCAKSVSDSVECILEGGRSCLVLGGDHSISVGSIHAHLKVAGQSKVALLYVDAHADLNTHVTSPSGNVHGMTVALLSQELQHLWEDLKLEGMHWLSTCLTLKNVAYIGMRSVDHGEVKFLGENDVAVFGVEDIDKFGIHKVTLNALEKIDPGANKSLHVSFDIDVLDPSEAPCTTCPVRGGLTLREAICFVEYLRKTKRVSVVDLVEINLAIGNEVERQITQDAANHILKSMYGHNRKGKICKTK